MSNEKEIFVIGHKTWIQIQSAQQSPMHILRTRSAKAIVIKQKRLEEELRDTVCSGQIWCEGTGICG